MKKGNNSRIARTLGLVVCSSIGFTAHAQDASALLKDWSFSGHYDIYFQYDGGKSTTAQGVNLRQFDVLNHQFGLAVLQLNATKKATAENPFGVTLQLTYGKNAAIINGTDPAGTAYQNVQQAFVTYAVPKTALTLDLGKYLTWIGYEGVVSADNDNYSRSFLFTLGEPIYHTGVRATYAATKTVTLNAYAVNGWNEVQDSNGATSYGATAAFAPNAKTSLTANYYGGVETGSSVYAIAPTGESGVQLGDFVGSYQLTDKIKLALNADYADAKAVGAGDPGGHWSGVAAYVVDQFTPKYGLGLRAETFSDPQGLKSGAAARYSSLTGTFSISGPGSSTLRFEVRYDKSNLDVFNAENGPKDNRVTYGISHVLRF
jgi:hypothetical protein